MCIMYVSCWGVVAIYVLVDGRQGTLYTLFVTLGDNHEIVACLGQQQPNKSSACSV